MRLFEVSFKDGRDSEFRFGQTKTDVMFFYWGEGFKVCEFDVYEIVIN